MSGGARLVVVLAGLLAFLPGAADADLAKLEKLREALSSALEAKSAERREHMESLREIRERVARERVLKERTRERIDGERRRGVEFLEESERKGEDLESTRAAVCEQEERIAKENRELETIGV